MDFDQLSLKHIKTKTKVIYETNLEKETNKHMQQRQQKTRIIRAVAHSVARLTCALPLHLFKSMTHDLDLKVTQVGHHGTT